jgi:hypothetical protein
MQHFTGMRRLQHLALAAADVNGDGVVNSQDALLIQRRFIGQIEEFQTCNWVYDDDIVTVENDIFTIIHMRSVGDVN